MEKDTKKAPLTPTIESETFESWTLIADPSAKPDIQSSSADKPGDDDHSRIEDLEKEPELQRSNDDNVDDLSDGISIISDNESAGRLSPHPNAECSSCDDIINLTETTTKQKKRAAYEPLTPPQTPSEVKEEPSQSTSAKFSKALAPIRTEVENANTGRPFIRISPLFFYLSVIVALIAFIGKVMYPEWVPASTNEHISPLTQKVEDLELQNNLLRAEIDLLSKQVNYMDNKKDNKKYKNDQKYYNNEQKNSGKKEEKLKVWPGGGDDSLKPMKILKGELYTPPNLEDFPNKKIHENIIDADVLTEIPVSKIVIQSIKDKVIEPAIGINLNEKITDQAAPSVNDKSYKDSTTKTEYHKEQLPKNQMYKGEKFDSEHYDKKMKYGEKQFRSGDESQDRKFVKNDYNKDNYKGHNKDKRENDSKYNYKKDNNKFQRYEKDNSKEYSQEKRDFDKKPKHKGDRDYDDDWHNKMMKHREDTRKKHFKENSDNWYIERGNGREEARVYDPREQQYKKKRR